MNEGSGISDTFGQIVYRLSTSLDFGLPAIDFGSHGIVRFVSATSTSQIFNVRLHE